MSSARGAFIVVEGGDRCGKTTFCKGIVSHLSSKNIKTEYCNFPDRTTEVGKIIDKYLKSKNGYLNDETISLLFTCNRWETADKLKNMLESGTTVVCDRYSFSGVAYTAAKGLDINWCKGPEIGLPKPDRVYLLKLGEDAQKQREGFGDERYDLISFQKKVFLQYSKMEDATWKILNAKRSAQDLINDEIPSIVSLIDEVKNKEILQMWKQANE